MRRMLVFCFCLFVFGFMIGRCSQVQAQNSSLNLQLPSGPTSFQSDKIRKGDMDCQNAVGGGMNLELGVTGIINNATGPFDRIDPMYPERKDVGVYARIVIPLDGPKERINCNTLYQLLLEKERLEVQRLRAELRNLQSLQAGKTDFEN